jgi:hypothetical protein
MSAQMHYLGLLALCVSFVKVLGCPPILRMASSPNGHREATGSGLTMALFSLAWYHQHTRSTNRFLIDTQPSSHPGCSTLQILPLSHCRGLSIMQKYRSLLSQTISTSRLKILRRCWRTCTTTRKRVRAFPAFVRPLRGWT